jgi:hypothetical protein
LARIGNAWNRRAPAGFRAGIVSRLRATSSPRTPGDPHRQVQEDQRVLERSTDQASNLAPGEVYRSRNHLRRVLSAGGDRQSAQEQGG